MPRVAALLLVLAGLALGVAACGSDADTDAAPPTTTAPTTTVTPPSGGDEDGVRGSGAPTSSGPPRLGDPVPEIVGTSFDGESISLADFRGKKVIVNLWSSW